jgi:hypothetical protein
LERALNLNADSEVDGTSIRVYRAASNPLGLEQFRAARNHRYKNEIRDPQASSKLTGASTRVAFNNRTKPRWHKNPPAQGSHNSLFTLQSGGTPGPHLFQALTSPELRLSQSSTNTQSMLRPSNNNRTAFKYLSRTSPAPIISCNANIPAVSDPRQSSSSLGLKTQTTTSSISPDIQLLLNFCGEDIIYDLKALESDTRFIIELLRITGSERGSWMTVSAYYRRSGNPQAAITVVKSMIEGTP